METKTWNCVCVLKLCDMNCLCGYVCVFVYVFICELFCRMLGRLLGVIFRMVSSFVDGLCGIGALIDIRPC